MSIIISHTFSLFFSSSASLYNAASYKISSNPRLIAVCISAAEGPVNINNNC